MTPAVEPSKPAVLARKRRRGGLVIAAQAVLVVIVGGVAVASGGSSSSGTTMGVSGSSGAKSSYRMFSLTLVDKSRPTVDRANPARNAATRTLRTEVYVPSGTGPFPVVMFAHGGGGSPDNFTQLLGAWAEAGFIIAAPAFPLTSTKPSVNRDALNQPADVSFVLDQVLQQAKDPSSPLYQRVDTNHVGVGGVSLGGATVLGLASCCGDSRIDAMMLMEPVKGPFANQVASFHTPVMFVHIKTDRIAPYSTSTEAFAAAPPPKFLMTLHGGKHAEPYNNTPSPHHHAVIGATTAFWNAYLHGPTAAVADISQAGTVPGQSDVIGTPRS